MNPARRFPIGAEPLEHGGVHFRVWAPKRKRVQVVERKAQQEKGGATFLLEAEVDGYFSGFVPSLKAGSLYSLRLDDEDKLYPDPASRFQPEGVHGPSQVVEPREFRFRHVDFRGPFSAARVIYELHFGTFTSEGTYAAATRELPELRSLGITTIELMPVADFSGDFGWGYDGVDLWAPSRLYGTPDELRAFVDVAHGLQMEVILDVVYNHLGPDGNYLQAFSDSYFSKKHETEWGDSPNFDGPGCAPVREFFLGNARYWIEEFQFDGLRIDATQSIFDDSSPHILAELSEVARSATRTLGKTPYLVAENEPQDGRIVRAAREDGFGCDALWNDDFHHSAIVALTGRREAYYQDYRGTPQELISALKWGYLYQGQYYPWQKQCRGEYALDLEAKNFVTYLQNHDQVANSASGQRLHRLTSPGELRALTTLMLLAPATPMLFQGQEFAASTDFLYFADPPAELAASLHRDRCKFLEQFPSIALPSVKAQVPNPSNRETFERSKLKLSERKTHAESYALHRELIALRQNDPVFCLQRADHMHGSILAERAFLLRFISPQGHRLLLVNLGTEFELTPPAEPLLACPSGMSWQATFSSEDPKFGGLGAAATFTEGRFHLPGRSSHVLTAVANGK